MEKISQESFISAWQETGGVASEVSRLLGLTVRNVYIRRNKIEAATGKPLPSRGVGDHRGRGDAGTEPNDYLQRLTMDGFTGVAVVFSDAHIWPNRPKTLAHLGLIEVIKEIKPKLIVANGDIFDGARLSRFPRNGWEYQPRVKDELEEARAQMDEIRHSFRGAQFIRTIGNHDIRFDRYLAMNATEMEQISGARLADHLVAWKECVSVFINGHTMIKHRFNGGIHAAYNNTLRAGTNIITGHTHHLEVKPWADYNGRRYGVQTGSLADINGPQFSYTENNPTPWCSGFAVLTFDSAGRLLYPELAEVIEDRCYFRGRLVVDGRKKRAR